MYVFTLINLKNLGVLSRYHAAHIVQHEICLEDNVADENSTSTHYYLDTFIQNTF